MKTNPVDVLRVLAIDPTSTGVGFAVMEGPESLIDWGLKEGNPKNQNQRCLELVADLIEAYRPDLLAVEDCRRKDSRRCERVRQLIDNMLGLASQKGIKVRRISTSAIKAAFSPLGARTKAEIAKSIAVKLPELSLRLPPYRYRWMPEDSRMNIFDAVSLALTFFHFKASRRKDPLLNLGINSTNHAQS